MPFMELRRRVIQDGYPSCPETHLAPSARQSPSHGILYAHGHPCSGRHRGCRRAATEGSTGAAEVGLQRPTRCQAGPPSDVRRYRGPDLPPGAGEQLGVPAHPRRAAQASHHPLQGLHCGYPTAQWTASLPAARRTDLAAVPLPSCRSAALCRHVHQGSVDLLRAENGLCAVRAAPGHAPDRAGGSYLLPSWPLDGTDGAQPADGLRGRSSRPSVRTA